MADTESINMLHLLQSQEAQPPAHDSVDFKGLPNFESKPQTLVKDALVTTPCGCDCTRKPAMKFESETQINPRSPHLVAWRKSDCALLLKDIGAWATCFPDGEPAQNLEGEMLDTPVSKNSRVSHKDTGHIDGYFLHHRHDLTDLGTHVLRHARSVDNTLLATSTADPAESWACPGADTATMFEDTDAHEVGEAQSHHPATRQAFSDIARKVSTA